MQAYTIYKGKIKNCVVRTELFEVKSGSKQRKSRLELTFYPGLASRVRGICFSAEKPRRLQKPTGLLPRAAFQIPFYYKNRNPI